VSDQLHAPVVYPRGNSPRYPLDRKLGGQQSLAGKLLLALASTVILDSESHESHGLVLLSDDCGRLQKSPEAILRR
jgi:hypothetical protein